ncbi:MAG: cytochrome c family protein [Bacteroidales bacterium]|nr:cytochrome c family protein [Bacteroidales bacterium]
MLTKRIFIFALLVFFAGGTLMAQNFKYIGASKCKMCHLKPAKGEQYNVWLKGPHAGAMKTLANEESKKIAAEMGIADPTTDPACIKCHSTVGSVDAKLIASAKMAEGVSCESCHGAGSMYKGASIMKNRDLAMQKGLVDPTEELCKTCHNEESPTYKPFNYAEKAALIAHPDPSKK